MLERFMFTYNHLSVEIKKRKVIERKKLQLSNYGRVKQGKLIQT